MIDLSKLPINITEHIQNFRVFLNLTWDHVIYNIMKEHNWDEDGRFIDDWMQVNWELLVEREILGKNFGLTQFYTHFRKSIFNPEREPEFIVIGKISPNERDVLTQKKIPEDLSLGLFSFNIFGSKNSLTFGPPFNLARLADVATHNLYTVPIENVEFMLCEYE